MEWHILLVAVAVGTSIHAVMEPTNILHKLSRLKTAIESRKITDPMMQGIDTRTKSYSLGIITISVLSLISYVGARIFNPSVEDAIKLSIAVVLIAEVILMLRIDKYHVEIEKITQSQKKK